MWKAIEALLGIRPFDKGTPELQAIVYQNRRVTGARFVAVTLCIIAAYSVHSYGVNKGVMPELSDSGFQYGEFIVSGYGFPGAFLGTGLILGLWGFGSLQRIDVPAGRDSGARSDNGSERRSSQP